MSRESLLKKKGQIWSLSDSKANGIWNHFVRKRTLNHLTKLSKWLRYVVSYLYDAFYCMFLSCQVSVWELIHTLQFRDCQGTLCSKKALNLKFKWLQRDSNPEPLSLQKNAQPFSQTGEIIDLCCEYLSVRCIWLYFLIAPCTHYRVNPQSIVAWMSRKFLL